MVAWREASVACSFMSPWAASKRERSGNAWGGREGGREGRKEEGREGGQSKTAPSCNQQDEERVRGRGKEGGREGGREGGNEGKQGRTYHGISEGEQAKQLLQVILEGRARQEQRRPIDKGFAQCE